MIIVEYKPVIYMYLYMQIHVCVYLKIVIDL